MKGRGLCIGLDDFGTRMIGAPDAVDSPEVGSTLLANGNGWTIRKGTCRPPRAVPHRRGVVEPGSAAKDGWCGYAGTEMRNIRHLLRGEEVRPWACGNSNGCRSPFRRWRGHESRRWRRARARHVETGPAGRLGRSLGVVPAPGITSLVTPAAHCTSSTGHTALTGQSPELSRFLDIPVCPLDRGSDDCRSRLFQRHVRGHIPRRPPGPEHPTRSTSSSVSMVDLHVTIARSMVFSSSRTFPGQSWSISIRSAPSEMPSPPCPAHARRSTKVLGKERNIFPSFAQRRNVDADDIQPVEQIIPEPPLPARHGRDRHWSLRSPEHRLRVPRFRRPGRISAPARTRRRSICSFGEISPISSRKIVPPSAISNFPLRLRRLRR